MSIYYFGEMNSTLISVYSQAAQTLNTINKWHYAVGDCITLLAVYKTMYENASKIALNSTCRKQFSFWWFASSKEK